MNRLQIFGMNRSLFDFWNESFTFLFWNESFKFGIVYE